MDKNYQNQMVNYWVAPILIDNIEDYIYSEPLKSKVPANDLLNIAMDYCGVAEQDRNSRLYMPIIARHITAWILYHDYNIGYTLVARGIKRGDHTTAMNAVKCATDRLYTDDDFTAIFVSFIAFLKNTYKISTKNINAKMLEIKKGVRFLNKNYETKK